MKSLLLVCLAVVLGACEARRGAGTVVGAHADPGEIRWMIANTVARDPHFGGWSIIGKPRFEAAALSPGRSLGSALFGGGGEEYCVSATMVVAGIPQPKSAFVTVYRSGSVATARVRPGNCTGMAPFPELQMAGAGR